jgi:hypothetical protein
VFIEEHRENLEVNKNTIDESDSIVTNVYDLCQ